MALATVSVASLARTRAAAPLAPWVSSRGTSRSRWLVAQYPILSLPAITKQITHHSTHAPPDHRKNTTRSAATPRGAPRRRRRSRGGRRRRPPLRAPREARTRRRPCTPRGSPRNFCCVISKRLKKDLRKRLKTTTTTPLKKWAKSVQKWFGSSNN